MGAVLQVDVHDGPAPTLIRRRRRPRRPRRHRRRRRCRTALDGQLLTLLISSSLAPD